MNVLHLTHTDIVTDSRILKQMNSLSENSYSIGGIGVESKEGSKETLDVENIKIYSIKLKARNWTFLPKAIRHFCSLVELTSKMFAKSLKLKPDIVHCNDTLVLPLGFLIKIFIGSKLVYDAHELESDKNGITFMLSKATLFVEKVLWRWIDALIVVSPSIKQWYKENVGEKRSEVILNSPIPKLDDKKNNYLREKFSIPNDSKIFLYIGILGSGRGIELVVDVFKRYNLKSSLVFLGYGEFSEKLKQLSEKHSNIYVHDAVCHEEVVQIAKSADVGLCLIENVSLSDYYCLPNKLFEYAFANIPILASNFPDISNAVARYNLGITSDLDVQSVYESIKKMEDLKELPKINTNLLHELSWETQEKKLIELYKYVSSKIKKGEK